MKEKMVIAKIISPKIVFKDVLEHERVFFLFIVMLTLWRPSTKKKYTQPTTRKDAEKWQMDIELQNAMWMRYRALSILSI